MLSRIESDRYTNTGFAVKDTPPEVNAIIFGAMMRKTPKERLLWGFDMAATARVLVWSRVKKQGTGTEDERRKDFYGLYHGVPRPW